MKQFLFIGDIDKTDILFCLAKVLSASNHKVIIIEVSENQRYQFAYPKVEMSSNLHQYDGFDVWENELDYENIQHFLKNSDYDLALIDIDNPNALKKWGQADDYFFLTSYEHPVIMQNTKLLESLFENQRDIELNPLTPVIHDVGVNQDENYLKGFVDHLPISWNESIIYYLNDIDMVTRIDNQTSNTVNIKKLSGPYKKMILQIIERILQDSKMNLKTLWKQAERSK